MCVAPGCPFSSSALAMAIPIMFTSRAITAGASTPTGSEKGGSQIRVGNGPTW
jgi:hypothetical protein